jgi:hypothetical protein
VPVHAVVDLNSSRVDLDRLRQAVRDFALSDATPQLRSAAASGLSYTLPEVLEAACGRRVALNPETPAGRILSILIDNQ